MPHVIRTTFEPDREIEVGDAELIDLRRQGLLVERPAVPTEGRKARTTEKGSDR